MWQESRERYYKTYQRLVIICGSGGIGKLRGNWGYDIGFIEPMGRLTGTRSYTEVGLSLVDATGRMRYRKASIDMTKGPVKIRRA